MWRVLPIAGTVLLTCAVGMSIMGASGPSKTAVNYGFGVNVVPDDEFDDFLRCGLVVYKLDDEQWQLELPALRIMTGDANTMLFTGEDGTEFSFKCFVDGDTSEVAYEIEGEHDGNTVLSHLGSVRFD